MSKTTKMVLWALTTACLLAAVILFALFQYYLPAAGAETGTPAYTIGAWQGQVAVFEGNKTYPRQVFEVFVSALPEELRHQVLAGVPAQTEDELSVLLEDFTG